MADSHLDALHSSVTRLHELASRIDEAELTSPAYPAEWTIAQVLSHLGAGAVIMQRRLEDKLAGRGTPDDFAPAVWDTWNAKTPTAQRADGLVADADLLERLEATAPEDRDRFTLSMGPLEFDFTEFVAMRLSEHVFHTWDVEVASDPAATLPTRVVAHVVDNLELVARFTAKPTGDNATVAVTTTSPDRVFTIALAPDSVAFQPGSDATMADLELPAEAFSRLVYGRLDIAHTPPGLNASDLALLRDVFPGP